ncbi:carbonic anhydrase [Altererythrobacter arenosus]|uniref:Carbonic anhydrase n=1 Tax=Altererythrobacter arenosus TaxID=3032592 RepID=A0ABY8FVD8_9SPHN|nr:carbonic anhydrase [Altererythrobacter sp. CAU 1644]WFL78969.1 carbonic anhydrase [Altererythrobacter sp. CAU 1644]
MKESDVLPLTPAEVLERLKEGNRRFLEDAPYQPPMDRLHRLHLAAAQRPFAAYLSCSDSRVPPELLFERGLGELFIVRNAGNTLCSSALGSLEFAVAHLQVPLIVVMGHEACGALRAAVAVAREQRQFSGNVSKVLQSLLPAVLEADPWAPDLVNAAALCNVRKVVRELREEASPALLEPQKAGRLRVVGAYYHLDSGRVDFLDTAD